jgi:hypothetical protein
MSWVGPIKWRRGVIKRTGDDKRADPSRVDSRGAEDDELGREMNESDSEGGDGEIVNALRNHRPGSATVRRKGGTISAYVLL